ncbi:MAG: SCO family protein [Hyphomicrobiales bacterium]|nr:SCO family protein [Hyphomicrobiales bacterium]
MSGRRLTFIAATLAAIAVLLGLDWIAYSRRPDAGAADPALALGGPFSLVGVDGKPVTQAIVAGKPYAIFFGYTHCPDECPTTLTGLTSDLAKLRKDGKSLAVLFVTFDPARDTPKAMGDFLQSFDPSIVGLTGTPQAIAAAAKEWRVYYRALPPKNGTYDFDHTSLTYLMDAHGALAGTLTPDEKPDVAMAKLSRLVGG